MAYIGKEPIVGNFQKCDAITVVNGQAAYTLQVSSTNVTPESANHMLVSLNGILQAPTTSFSVSGSTLTFASNLATGDVIDFVMLLGNVLDLGVPSDDTVGAAQIKDDLISGTTALASEPADTDEFLVSDAGTLKRIDYSLIKGGGANTLISTTTASDDASVSIAGMDSTYKIYTITLNAIIGATDGVTLYVAPIIGGAVKTDAYHSYGQTGRNSGTGAVGNESATSTYWKLNISDSGNDTGEHLNGEIKIYDPSNTTETKMIIWTTATHLANTSVTVAVGAGHYNNGEAAMTGLNFRFASGNITSGVFKLWGTL